MNFGGYTPSASSLNFGQTYTPSLGVTTDPATANYGNMDFSTLNGGSDAANQFDWSKGYGAGGNSGVGSAANTLGANIPTFQLGLSGLTSLGNLWGAFQSNKLANNQFDYTKQITNTNLANQIKSYNTSLSDKATARASMEGWSDSQTQDYIDKNKLSK